MQNTILREVFFFFNVNHYFPINEKKVHATPIRVEIKAN